MGILDFFGHGWIALTIAIIHVAIDRCLAIDGMIEQARRSGAAMGIGTEGENLVADWLATKKAVVLQRRWRKRSAEVDLIAQKADGTLLFIEVKTRSAGNWDRGGLLAVDRRKQQKIILGAHLFLGCYPELSDCNCRFDVALVQHGRWDETAEDLYSQCLDGGRYLSLVEYLVAAFDGA
jgi:putative endonuclease